jgi:guanylate kinase
MKKIILLVGASGSGKSTLETNLLKFSDEFYKAISTTTRPPRKGEINGVDYFFVNRETFAHSKMIESTEFAGNLYGISEDQLHKEKTTILVVEPNGAKQILDYAATRDIEVTLIYLNISKKNREKNMEKRGDSKESIEKRIKNDNIEELWKKNKLLSDLTITELSPDLHIHVYEWLKVQQSL